MCYTIIHLEKAPPEIMKSMFRLLGPYLQSPFAEKNEVFLFLCVLFFHLDNNTEFF